MSKLTIDLSSESAVAANPYIMADGMLNFDAISKLQDKVAAAIKNSATAAKLLGTYVMKRRAKPVKYSAAMEKKRDHKYLVARATKLVLRKRVTPESLARVAVVLQVIDDAKLAPAIKQAQTAIARHLKKIEPVLGKVTKEKGKLRDAANATFDKSITMLKTLLANAGVKETDMIESVGMMGKSVLLRLGKDNVVSIGKADSARFAAAVKASKAATA